MTLANPGGPQLQSTGDLMSFDSVHSKTSTITTTTTTTSITTKSTKLSYNDLEKDAIAKSSQRNVSSSSESSSSLESSSDSSDSSFSSSFSKSLEKSSKEEKKDEPKETDVNQQIKPILLINPSPDNKNTPPPSPSSQNGTKGPALVLKSSNDSNSDSESDSTSDGTSDSSDTSDSSSSSSEKKEKSINESDKSDDNNGGITDLSIQMQLGRGARSSTAKSHPSRSMAEKVEKKEKSETKDIKISNDQEENLIKTVPKNHFRKTTLPISKSGDLNTLGSEYLSTHGGPSILSNLMSSMKHAVSAVGPLSQIFSNSIRMTNSNISSSNYESMKIEPFELIPEPEYSVSVNDKLFKKNDKIIEKNIKDDKLLYEESWRDSAIKHIDEGENPFKSPYAEKLMQDGGKDIKKTIPVKFFSEKVNQVEMYDVTEPQRAEFKASESIKFIDDSAIQQNEHGEPSVFGSFSIGQPAPNPRFKLNRVKEEHLHIDKTHFLAISVKSFEMKPKPLEPLLFSACLFDISEKKFISEEWHFSTDFSIQIYKNKASEIKLSLNDKSAFELPRNIESEIKQKNIYLVIAISHPLTVDDNLPVKKYYQTKSGDGNAKKNISKTFPRNKDVLSTFAWTYVKVSDILKSTAEDAKEIKLPNAFEINEPFSSSRMKEYINDANKNKLKPKYDFQLVLTCQSKKIIHPITEISEYFPIYLAEKPAIATHPSIHLRHKLQIRLEQVNFKPPSGIKARNIFGVLTIRNTEAGEPLVVIHSRFDPPNITKNVTTKCFYHDTKGTFDELFVVDLPYPLADDLCIVVEFFHLICKKANTDRSKIGRAVLPINKDRNIIADGEHSVNILYGKEKSDGASQKVEKENSLSLITYVDSYLVSNDQNLMNFYKSNGKDVILLQEASKDLLVKYFYYIIELLVTNLLTDPANAIKGMNIIVKVLEPDIKQRIEEYLNVYAQVFSFRETDKSYHKKIFEGLAKCGEVNPLLYNFLYMLIIKSIYLTKEEEFGESYESFLKAVPKRIANEEKNSIVIDYARFMNLLFDIGRFSASIKGIQSLVNALVTKKEICLFVYEVFRPKLLYVSLMNSEEMYQVIVKLLQNARCDKEGIFKSLVEAIEILPDIFQRRIAIKLLDTLLLLSPIEKMPFARNCSHPVISYFAFILEKIKEDEDTIAWFRKPEFLNSSDKENFFNSLHFLLDVTIVDKNSNARQKEIAYAVQMAVLNVMAIMQNACETLQGMMTLIYHFLWINIVDELYSLVVGLLIMIAERDVSFLFEFSVPSLPKILIRLFKKRKDFYSLSEFLNVIIEKDQKMFKNNKRSLALICRAIYYLKYDELKAISLDDENFKGIRSITTLINDYADTLNNMNNSISLEMRSRLIWRQIQLMKPSPDAVIEILSDLFDFHIKEGYDDEAIQTRLLIAAIVLEILTLQGRVKPFFYEIHAAHVFDKICSMVPFALVEDDEYPTITGMCDSGKFNLKSVTALLSKIIKFSVINNKLYESSFELIDILWPIYESQRAFGYVRRLFQNETLLQRNLAAIPAETDRLFGHYFRIAFYGKIFGEEDDGQTYIYHEKLLTHLFELSTRLIEQCKSRFPGTEIELIKESGKVNASELDENKGYIQITFVTPYFPKEELKRRITKYDQSHMIKTFMFDTPFTNNIKGKVQGSIEQQWLRKTLLSVENPMPSIFKLEKVNKIEVKELSPIRVSYRQLRDRVTQMEMAVSQLDFRNIQQLLHGSLLVMVNEGPSKMAEVFLPDDAELEGDQKKMPKYKEKLKKAFRMFIKANEEALQEHAKHVAKNPMFIPLQNELEAGFVSLSERLMKYIKSDS